MIIGVFFIFWRGICLLDETAKQIARRPKSVEAGSKSVEAGPKSVEAGPKRVKTGPKRHRRVL